MPTSDPQHPQQLLDHLDFVRALARDLLADSADDLVQDACVAALQHRPDSPARMEGWLAIIVRNLSRNRRRSEQRRRWHEARAALPQTQDAVAEVLAREETRRKVVQAVLALDEPYRGTILATYFDGLSCAEIARQSGERSVTVRSRLRRALAKLRERLDREHDMRRAAWAVPLVPLARGATAASAAYLSLSTKTALGVAAAVVLVGAAMLWIERTAPSGGSALDAPLVTETAEANTAQAPEPEDAPSIARDVVASTPARAARVYPGKRGAGSVHGVVLDETRTPVAGAIVTLRPDINALPFDMQLADDRSFAPTVSTGDTGSFAFSAVPGGPCVVSARAGDLRASAWVGVVAGGDEQVWLKLEDDASAHRPLVVDVVDVRGFPVARVPVQLFGCVEGRASGSSAQPVLETQTDHGHAVFGDARVLDGIVIARTAAGDAGWQRVPVPPDAEVPYARIVVAALGGLQGQLVGVPADELGETVVSAHALDTSPNATGSAHGLAYSAAVTDGCYELRGLPAGEYALTLRSAGGACLALPPSQAHEASPSSGAVLRVAIESGATRREDLPVQRGGTISVVVRGRDDEPIRDASVLATFGPKNTMEVDGAPAWHLESQLRPVEKQPHPLICVSGRTSTSGEIALVGLQPGVHRVEVVAAGQCYDRANEVEVKPGETTRVAFRLAPDGVLQALVPLRVRSVGLRRKGAGHLHAWSFIERGSLTMPALRPGSYEVLEASTGNEKPWRVLGSADVHAGRTTVADFRADGVEYGGLVVDAEGPMSGVTVGFVREPPLTVTDARGGFRLRAPRWLTENQHTRFELSKGSTSWWIRRDFAELPRAGEMLFRLPPDELIVQTLGADGRPAPARVFVDTTSYGPSTKAVIDASDAGVARIDHVFPGEYTIVALFADGQRAIARTMVPAAEPVVLRALPAGEIEVFVHDQNGIPLAYSFVTAGPLPRRSLPGNERYDDRIQSVITGPDGRGRLRGVVAGRNEVRTAPSIGPRGSSSTTEAVLKAGQVLVLDVAVRVGARD